MKARLETAMRVRAVNLLNTTPNPPKIRKTPWYLDAAAIGAILAVAVALYAVFGDLS